MTSSKHDGQRKPARNLGWVLLAGLTLTAVSGRVRGPEPDRWAGQLVQSLQHGTQRLLADHWCHPQMAAAIVGFTSFALFCLAVLAAGDAIRRLPCVSEFQVESDLGRRRGRKLSAIAVALGFSLPAAAALAFTSKSGLSLYAVLYFVLAYGFVVFSTEPESSQATLTFYSRFRNALARGCERERGDEDAEELDCG